MIARTTDAEGVRPDEAEARVVGGMADDDDDVVAGGAAGGESVAHQRRADASVLPRRAHRHRRERHDRGRLRVARELHRCEEDVSDDRVRMEVRIYTA